MIFRISARAGAFFAGAILLSVCGCGGADGRGSAPAATAVGSDEPEPASPAEVATDADLGGAPGEIIGEAPAPRWDEDDADAAAVDRIGFRKLAGGPLDREASFGKPAPRVRESTPLSRRTPRAIFDAIIAAIGRDDAAALARASRSRESHPDLDEDDVADARRRFLASPTDQLWARLDRAVRSDAYEETDDGPGRALWRVDVGGALAVHTLRFHEESDGWYLDR